MKIYFISLIHAIVISSFSMAQDWEKQFVDDSFDGWQIFRNQDNRKSGWSIENGVLTYNSEEATGKGNKSLISDATYRNFEIKFDWKVSPKGNSGFMWGVSLDEKFEHPYESGPEIQVLDPAVYIGDSSQSKAYGWSSLWLNCS